MKPFCLWLLLAPASLLAADGVPAGWQTWAPRAEIAPRTFVDNVHYRTHPGSLAVSGNGNAGEHGGWERVVSGIEPGSWYRFTAYYRVAGVPYESMQILPRVDWRTSAGKPAGRADYPYRAIREGEWNRVAEDVQAPAGTATATLQLFLFNAPQGTVWWDDVSFEKVEPPAPRKVTVASLNLRPRNTHSAEENIRLFAAGVDPAIPQKTDIILLPESITVVGNGKTYLDVAETVPGPTTEALGAVAKRRSSYLVVGIIEREGAILYNTDVLIGRHGEIAGKYRKVQLPDEEVQGGVTPGNDYPVFQTDFGTIGLMTCYDVMFPDTAHALARQGAEIILMPIWGGDETLAKARAIENKVFLVASGYDHPTYIMDPDGERLATATEKGTAAVFTIDLSKRYLDYWMGDMRARRRKEERVDLRSR